MTASANLFPTFSRTWERLSHVRAGLRARARLSVRALMVLVLMTGGGMGWLERGAQIQRDAVAAVRRSGGRCRYDWIWRVDPPWIDPYGP